MVKILLALTTIWFVLTVIDPTMSIEHTFELVGAALAK